MTFSVAIRTVPARRVLYTALIAQLTTMCRSNQSIHISERVDVTPNENGCLALESAARQGTPWVIFLEDDAGLIHDFFGSVERWLSAYARPDIHLYPLGAAYSRCFSEKSNVWEYPISAYYCSVAFAIRTEHVGSAVAYLRANPHVTQGFDLMLGHWHRTVSPSEIFLTPVPCFVDHLGDDSTLVGNRPDHNVVGHFHGFRGYDYSYQPEVTRG